MSISLLLLAAIAGLLAIQTLKKPPEQPHDNGWAYSVVTVKGFSIVTEPNGSHRVTQPDNLLKTLNQVGAENWELVSTLRETVNAGTLFESPQFYLILKRRVGVSASNTAQPATSK
jgi:hypothetical protein